MKKIQTMKQILVRTLFGRPVELPVLPVTVPAPVGPARSATPAEQRLREAATLLADAKRVEASASVAYRNAYNARYAAEQAFDKLMQEVSRP